MHSKISSIKLFNLIILFIMLTGCGFHLRGSFTIPQAFRSLRISPNLPFDPFQRALRETLTNNGVVLIPDNDPRAKESATLIILTQAFSERTVAYGSDGQPTRAIIQLKIFYQINGPNGKSFVPDTAIQVEHDLTINPLTFLATENERNRLKNDLITDSASQLVRQLSLMSVN